MKYYYNTYISILITVVTLLQSPLSLNASTTDANIPLHSVTQDTYTQISSNANWKDFISNVHSAKDIQTYLQGSWVSDNQHKLIFKNNKVSDPLSIENSPPTNRDYFILSSTEMMILYSDTENYTDVLTISYAFNNDFSKLYLFATDQYGVPLRNTIDEWTRQP